MTRNAAQNICSQRPWNMRGTMRMLPTAPNRPTIMYNSTMIAPPIYCVPDPVPPMRLSSNAPSILLIPLKRFFFFPG